jgi:hypothetical protein
VVGGGLWATLLLRFLDFRQPTTQMPVGNGWGGSFFSSETLRSP